MLAISRALMARPRVLLLDEPSLGLSPRLVKEIFAIIRRINEERGVTILLVEQNANMALQLSDYGYVLEVGRIVMEGDSARLLENEDIREFYLGQKEQGARGKRRWKKKKSGDRDRDTHEARAAGYLTRLRHHSEALRQAREGARAPRRHARQESRRLGADHLARLLREGPRLAWR